MSAARHLYVHVPFCRRRCVYCDFSIAVRPEVPSERFVDTILREFELAIERDEEQWAPLETLYFGGGTPSRLDPGSLARLATGLLGTLGAVDDVEVTVEANPEDVQAAAARAWRDAGVNRVSLGVQSFDDQVLSWMHRSHDPEAARHAVDALHEAGIDNVSLDLIFALPPALDADFDRSLREAMALRPTHLSVYGLTVEPRTPLARWISRGAVRLDVDDAYVAEFLTAHEVLTTNGFEHYEVSNFAQAGFRSRHNSAYWSGAAYVGLGPAAHSHHSGSRRWNLRAWRDYEGVVDAGSLPIENEEHLTSDQERLEAVYLGLRTRRGIALADLPAWPNAAADRALAAGWLEMSGGRLWPTVEGWLRLDGLIPALTTKPGGG